jgi:hypothetical protein
MALQLSVAVRNARLDAVETAIGASPHLRILTGAVPASCADAQTGTLLCQIALQADWMSQASGGVKTMYGTWTGTGAAAGNAGYFRVVDTAGTTCHVQGTVTAPGGGGDMTLDNVSIAVSQGVTVNSFQLTEANA